ncbi:MAG TPA: hypothetical protein VNE82_02890 [Candidatus Binataceae bacterium]|nr:hypothetical protein [Candidatus Binataceae bacterium]
MKFFEQLNKLSAAMVEMPFVAARSVFAQNSEQANGEQELQQAGWKAYDAWVRLLSESANGLYASPEVGASVGRSMDASLKWQRLGSAMTGAFFAALWPALGLPSAAELTELRAEVGALRDDLAEARLEAEEARAAEVAAPAGEHQERDLLTAMWNGGWTPATAPFVRKRGEDAPAN